MNLTRTLIIGMTTIALLTATAPAAQAGPVSDLAETWMDKVRDRVGGINGCVDDAVPWCNIARGDLDGACDELTQNENCRRI